MYALRESRLTHIADINNAVTLTIKHVAEFFFTFGKFLISPIYIKELIPTTMPTSYMQLPSVLFASRQSE